eukprot:3182451-Pyramimonas_sp.AAC.1
MCQRRTDKLGTLGLPFAPRKSLRPPGCTTSEASQCPLASNWKLPRTGNKSARWQPEDTILTTLSSWRVVDDVAATVAAVVELPAPTSTSSAASAS